MKTRKAFLFFFGTMIFLGGYAACAETQVKADTIKSADKKAELNGSSWDIVRTRLSDSEKSAENDIFTFQNGQFRSLALSKRGFSDTNFTMNAPSLPSDPIAWETMQKGREGVVFIQGEWLKDNMHGNISEMLENGQKIVEYSFITRKHWQQPRQQPRSETVSPKPVVVKKVVPTKPSKKVSKPKTVAPKPSVPKLVKSTQKKLSFLDFFAKKDSNVSKVKSVPAKLVQPVPETSPAPGADKFSEEIEKFEKAQAAALKPAQ